VPAQDIEIQLGHHRRIVMENPAGCPRQALEEQEGPALQDVQVLRGFGEVLDELLQNGASLRRQVLVLDAPCRERGGVRLVSGKRAVV